MTDLKLRGFDAFQDEDLKHLKDITGLKRLI